MLRYPLRLPVRKNREQRVRAVSQLLTAMLATPTAIDSIDVSENASPVGLSPAFSVSMGILAFYSSAVFFPSALQAGQRYAKMKVLSSYESPIVYGSATASVVTNAFFNWPAYCDIWGNHDSFLEWCRDAAKAFCENPGRHAFAFVASAGTILPFWYVSLKDNIGWNIFVSTAAIANIPVFYCGSEIFFEVMAYAEVEWLRLQCCLLLYAIACQDVTGIKQSIEHNQLKSLLVRHFLQLADDFRMASDEEKNNFVSFLLSAADDERLLGDLLNRQANNEMLPHYHNPIRESYILIGLKFFVLGGLGMLQNFGHVVEAYQSGAEYHFVVGVIFALSNLLPGLGYTVKGIMGFGLVELFVELFLGKKTQQATSCLYTMVMLIVLTGVRMAYVFSGMSGDQLNYDSALYCSRGKYMLFASILGFLANIGTALVFNAPQVEIKLKEIQHTKPTTLAEGQFRECQKQLDEWVEVTRRLPLSDIDVLMNQSKIGDVMSTFFSGAKSEKSVAGVTYSPLANRDNV